MNEEKPRSPRRTVWPIDFSPLAYLPALEQDRLVPQLMEAAGTTSFEVSLIRRRNRFAIELPLGLFSKDLRPGATTVDDEVAALLDRLDAHRRQGGHRGFDPNRHIFEHGGRRYYHREALHPLCNIVVESWLYNSILRAALACIEQAESAPSAITGPRYKPRLVKPEDRPMVNGHRARGHEWLPSEDAVLHQWFGRRADGKHHRLTGEEWTTVLGLLGGYRTRQSVKDRLSALNRKLKISLMVDGYIPRDKVKAYTDGCLGEMVRVPRYRPRLHGTYHQPAPEDRRRKVVRAAHDAAQVSDGGSST